MPNNGHGRTCSSIPRNRSHHKNLRRTKPKGYFSDTGLACYLARITSSEAMGGHPMSGSLFETAVISEIRKLMTPLARKAALYHWRIYSGSEVDLILERDGILYPIEIKLTSRPSRKDVRGICALRTNCPDRTIAPGLVIAPAEQLEQLSENEYTLPWNLA